MSRGQEANRDPWGRAASRVTPAVPGLSVQEVLQDLWDHADPRVCGATSAPKVTPGKSDLRAFREIQGPSAPREIKAPSGHREIRGIWDLLVPKGNEGKKATVVPPENRGLPECKDLLESLVLRASRVTGAVPGHRANRAFPARKDPQDHRGNRGFRGPKEKRAIPEHKERKATPVRKGSREFKGRKAKKAIPDPRAKKAIPVKKGNKGFRDRKAKRATPVLRARKAILEKSDLKGKKETRENPARCRSLPWWRIRPSATS